MKRIYFIISLLIIFISLASVSAYADTDACNPDTIFQNHKSVMLLIDSTTGDIIDANSAAADFYGYTREELTKMKISDINTLSDQEIEEEMKAAILEKRNYFEFKHRIKDGSIKDVEVYSSPASDKTGNAVLFSIVHDITAKKQAEREVISNKMMVIYLLGAIIVTLIIAVVVINRVKKNERTNKNKFKSLFENMNEGFALHEIVVNQDGQPVDYRFLDANHAFEKITGLQIDKIKDKTVKEVFPNK